MVEQLNTKIDVLSLDHRRGAAEIVQDSIDLFISIAGLSNDSPISADHLFNRAVRRLAKGQPTMAPILNLLNRLCLARENSGEDWDAFAEQVRALGVRRSDNFTQMMQKLDGFAEVENLIVFSNSSTVVRQVVTSFRQYGWPKMVWCGEGRPVMEGIVTAQRLTSAGLNVTVYTDAALMSLVTEADAVWIGGDCLSHEGLVNKIGSKALAILAGHAQIPFVSMMSTDKFLSRGLTSFFKFLPQNPREIAGSEADALKVENQYYERIPLDLITTIMTEFGASDPKTLVQSITEEPVSQTFTELLSC